MFRVQLFAAIGIGGLAATMAACSSNTAASNTMAGGPPNQSVCTDPGLFVAFNPMYSAFIPPTGGNNHTFQVPAIVVGSTGKVTWSADSSMVQLAPGDHPNGVMIQTLQAGDVTINLQSDDGKCGSAQLHISSFTESDWQIGNDRYNNYQRLPTSSVDGGSPYEQGGSAPACNSCHGVTAVNSIFVDVAHTPEQTGGFSDEDLINIVVNGIVPDGGYFDRTIVPYAGWQYFHRWSDIGPDKQKGIVAYLRSLTPSPQKGSVNFGAFMTDAAGLGTGPSEGDAGAGATD
jgi:hypothetical protein